MKNLTIVSNPLVKRDVTILRDKETLQDNFRLALRRISYALVNKISEEFPLEDIKVETPLVETNGHKLKQQIVLVPVLRAGLSMVAAFIEMIPNAKVGHIGMQRDEETLKPIDYYYKTPGQMETSKIIVLDPMLATGGSASAAISHLKKHGANDLSLCCLIAAPEGVEKMAEDHADVKVYTAALDEKLNEVGYIVPGLGDAGDRTFGTL